MFCLGIRLASPELLVLLVNTVGPYGTGQPASILLSRNVRKCSKTLDQA